MPGLAVMPNGTEAYAGAAGGGVWKTTNSGTRLDAGLRSDGGLDRDRRDRDRPSDQSIWVGTGENNTAFENHKGVGVFRSANHGASWTQVGPNVTNSTIGDLEFDGQGNVYVATSRGLFSRSTSAPASAMDQGVRRDDLRVHTVPVRALDRERRRGAAGDERPGRRREHGVAFRRGLQRLLRLP